MKIAVVYTSTTPELIQMVDESLNRALSGLDAEIMNYRDPSILAEARDNGGVTPGCARRLLDLYERAARDGARVILNVCSSVGDVAKLCKPLYEATGVKFVRIDEDMARAAVEAGGRIGVIATLPTTLEPTKRLILETAARLGKSVTLVDGLADGAFGQGQDAFKQKLIDTASGIAEQVDVLLFAQGSMAYAEEAVEAAVGKKVFSSVRPGAEAVRREVTRLLAQS